MRRGPSLALIIGAAIALVHCGARTPLEAPDSAQALDAAPQYSDASQEWSPDEFAVPFPTEQCAAPQLGGVYGGATECDYRGARWGPEYIYLDVSADGLAGRFWAEGRQFVDADGGGREQLPDGGLRFPPLLLRLHRTSNDRFELIDGQSARLYWPNGITGDLYHDVHFLRGGVSIERGVIRFESRIKVDVDASSISRVVEDCLRYVGMPCARPWNPVRDRDF